jgi:hypothetical protein
MNNNHKPSTTAYADKIKNKKYDSINKKGSKLKAGVALRPVSLGFHGSVFNTLIF